MTQGRGGFHLPRSCAQPHGFGWRCRDRLLDLATLRSSDHGIAVLRWERRGQPYLELRVVSRPRARHPHCSGLMLGADMHAPPLQTNVSQV
jgi:hypothetical protein